MVPGSSGPVGGPGFPARPRPRSGRGSFAEPLRIGVAHRFGILLDIDIEHGEQIAGRRRQERALGLAQRRQRRQQKRCWPVAQLGRDGIDELRNLLGRKNLGHQLLHMRMARRDLVAGQNHFGGAGGADIARQCRHAAQRKRDAHIQLGDVKDRVRRRIAQVAHRGQQQPCPDDIAVKLTDRDHRQIVQPGKGGLHALAAQPGHLGAVGAGIERHVEPGTEIASGAAEHDALDRRIGGQLLGRIGERAAHLDGQRVVFVGAVQDDIRARAVDFYEYIFRVHSSVPSRMRIGQARPIVFDPFDRYAHAEV